MSLLEQYELDKAYAERMANLEKQLQTYFNEDFTRKEVMMHAVNKGSFQQDTFIIDDVTYSVNIQQSTKEDVVDDEVKTVAIEQHADITIYKRYPQRIVDPTLVIQLYVVNDNVWVTFTKTENEESHEFDFENVTKVLKEFIGV